MPEGNEVKGAAVMKRIIAIVLYSALLLAVGLYALNAGMEKEWPADPRYAAMEMINEKYGKELFRIIDAGDVHQLYMPLDEDYGPYLEEYHALVRELSGPVIYAVIDQATGETIYCGDDFEAYKQAHEEYYGIPYREQLWWRSAVVKYE